MDLQGLSCGCIEQALSATIRDLTLSSSALDTPILMVSEIQPLRSSVVSKCVYQLPLADRSLICHHNLLDTIVSVKHCAHFQGIQLPSGAFLPMSQAPSRAKVVLGSLKLEHIELTLCCMKSGWVARNVSFSDSVLYFSMLVQKQYYSKGFLDFTVELSVSLYGSLLLCPHMVHRRF